MVKPSPKYSAEDADNALADMFFLELMFNAHALFPGVQPVLYTRDVGIAALWTALQPSEYHVTHLRNAKVRTTITFNLTGFLFPALSEDEISALKSRLLL